MCPGRAGPRAPWTATASLVLGRAVWTLARPFRCDDGRATRGAPATSHSGPCFPQPEAGILCLVLQRPWGAHERQPTPLPGASAAMPVLPMLAHLTTMGACSARVACRRGPIRSEASGGSVNAAMTAGATCRRGAAVAGPDLRCDARHVEGSRTGAKRRAEAWVGHDASLNKAARARATRPLDAKALDAITGPAEPDTGQDGRRGGARYTRTEGGEGTLASVCDTGSRDEAGRGWGVLDGVGAQTWGKCEGRVKEASGGRAGVVFATEARRHGEGGWRCQLTF